MSFTLLSVLTLGFFLGIRHSMEPDHVIAVSTIASQSKKLWHATLAGVFWGIGHTLTLFIFGIVLILFKNDISETWSLSLEFLVGIMLVYLGMVSILAFKRKKQVHIHNQEKKHDHSKKKIRYHRSLFIGTIHGLAGSAAMVLLTMSTVHSIWQGGIYILIFGLGTITGMLLFTTVIGIPFVLVKNRGLISRSLIMTTGAISTLFGIYYMYNLGINEGLFKLWF